MMTKLAALPMIPFIDLKAQRQRLGAAVDAAILRVVDHGGYILGPEVKELEWELARFTGASEVVTCANGTDALALVLMAKGVGPGDAIFCPAFTFAATAEVVAWVGATAVFVDVLEDTFNMDPESLKSGISTAKKLDLRPTAVITVDLFGQPAQYDAIEAIVAENKLWLLSDAAQSFGATWQGRKVGTIGAATSTSFFPAKPLGCYGDGGAVFTDDPEMAMVMRSLRMHGEGSNKYDNVRVGMNGRLDTMQAAVLLEKLKIFPDEIRSRDLIAARYNSLLADVVTAPTVAAGATSVWAQYTVRIAGGRRSTLASTLAGHGIPTAIYYPKPLNRQPAYNHYPVAGNGVPVSERIADEVISLPMHPYLTEDVQDRIVDVLRTAILGKG